MWQYNYSDELYHFGIKGQKWGVRRYQNKDGSLTPAGKKRLDKYKTRHNKIVDKKYKLAKLDKKRASLERKADKKIASLERKMNKKITKARYEQLRAEGMHYLEKNAVNNMTYKEMSAEKVKVGKAFAQAYISATLTANVASAITGTPMVAAAVVNVDKLHTNSRVSAEDRLKVDNAARDATGYKKKRR